MQIDNNESHRRMKALERTFDEFNENGFLNLKQGNPMLKVYQDTAKEGLVILDWEAIMSKEKITLTTDERFIIESLIRMALRNGHLRKKINDSLRFVGKDWDYVESDLLKKIGLDRD